MSINRNLAAMAGNVNVSGIVSGASGGTITGEVKMWATGTAPTGYLMCDGSVISRTTYANLFAVIGTTFGSGDGSTTFKLPSFQNRMPIGAGSTYSANTTGGSADAIVPSHSHTFSGDALPAHNHTIPYGTGFFGGGGSNGIEAGSSRPSYPLGNSSVSGGTPSGTISTAGVSATNANLPPYIGIHFIIRT